jgi:hypothetical protein
MKDTRLLLDREESEEKRRKEEKETKIVCIRSNHLVTCKKKSAKNLHFFAYVNIRSGMSE